MIVAPVAVFSLFARCFSLLFRCFLPLSSAEKRAESAV
jgi:hypothetical protein